MEQNLYLAIGLLGAIIFFFGFMTGRNVKIAKRQSIIERYKSFDDEDDIFQ
jgi:VIT1/CCC1 family predicted Fe2+/Mn2+ transporter